MRTPVSAHDVAAELRRQQPGLPAVKLHKLLYYCQGHHLAVFGEPLFTETLEAWDMGPVVAELWRAEKYRTPIPAPVELGEAELNTVGYILSRYGALTGRDLEILSHGEDPWKLADQGRRPGEAVRIDPEVITRYFRDHHFEDDGLDRAAVSKWLRESATQPRGPDRPDSLDAMQSKRDAIAAGLRG